MSAALVVPFLYALRSRGVPVGAQEAVALAEALGHGLHNSSLDRFYHVARAVMVHSERHLDAFDQAFSAHFRGVDVPAAAIHDELLEWLKQAAGQRPELTDEERALFDAMDPEEIERLLRERLENQKERHDGGSRHIGTGGKSPFGHSGAARQGIRIGGKGGGRSAIRVADARLYQGYREDLVLDVRQMQVALRKLRAFNREGGERELDIEGTIDATASNAGELEVITRPPRRPDTRLILLMDVGGSMDPYAHLVSRLFSAAKKSTHFKELHTYYFHNCVYGRVYGSENFDQPKLVPDLLHECGPHFKLVLVGDALMAPYELMAEGGFRDIEGDERTSGLAWLMRLREHFHRSVWLNPEPKRMWRGNTIETLAEVYPMFPLTLEGLGEGMSHLVRVGRG